MQVYFLSDIHLASDTEPKARRLTKFLAEEPSGGDLLILGGDIFDLLVGDKRLFRERYGALLVGLILAAERGVVVHYLEGNHDFHFAEIFAGKQNIFVHKDDFALSPMGRRLFISHGDLIDPTDRGYRLLRAITKNRPFAAFVRALPDRVVDFIGTRSSGASRKYTTGRAENEGTDRLRRLYLDFAREKIRTGFQHVLVGHSHLRDQVELEGGEYINLGFSPDALLYAVLGEGDTRFSLKTYP